METASKQHKAVTTENSNKGDLCAFRWTIEGYVQGVGFRPFVFRLAKELKLVGRVWNEDGCVLVEAQGEIEQLSQFENRLIQDAPNIADARIVSCIAIDTSKQKQFSIEPSQTAKSELTTESFHIPPDYAVCETCLAEMHDPHNRRYRYPFVNCTQCGPRYTIIEHLPYDRPFTSMKEFPLCSECEKEYRNPADRRFHAQATACPNCGPQLYFTQPGNKIQNVVRGNDSDSKNNENALAAAIDFLAQGKIIAVKGIGGYHLMVDATNISAIARLRQRKHRPHKPFAVMFPTYGKDGLSAVKKYAEVNEAEAKTLFSDERPIVLLKLCNDGALPEILAPGMKQIGAFLPYSPLHHLLMDTLARPLVATSANLSGDPVLTDNADAESRLTGIADGFLHHNRPILRSADDSVYRYIQQRLRPIRLGRGAAPLEMALPFSISKPLLALGAQQKNTLCLAWNNRLVLSPHIADLNNYRSQQLFEHCTSSLPALFNVDVQQLACDAHPDYHATRYAKHLSETTDKALHSVFHHHAHAAALCGEHGRFNEDTLVFTWDGTGLGVNQGSENSLWGGEAFLGRPGCWQRRASFRPFPLLGGERAIRESWRVALSLCWEAGFPLQDYWQENLQERSKTNNITSETIAFLNTAWQRKINCLQTSAVGRLFDAASSLLGLVDVATYEAQAPMMLEELACSTPLFESDFDPVIRLPQHKDEQGVLRCDWAPLIPLLTNRQSSVAERAASFHLVLADALVTQALDVRDCEGINYIGLTGGVFQNKLLTELTVTLLEKQGFEVIMPERIPANDASISYGQIMEILGRENMTRSHGLNHGGKL